MSLLMCWPKQATKCQNYTGGHRPASGLCGRLGADVYNLVVVGRRRDRLEELAIALPNVEITMLEPSKAGRASRPRCDQRTQGRALVRSRA